MSSKKQPADTKSEAPAEETLVPFNVVIEGQDRTIFAKDEEDLKARLEKLRSSTSSTPATDGQ